MKCGPVCILICVRNGCLKCNSLSHMVFSKKKKRKGKKSIQSAIATRGYICSPPAVEQVSSRHNVLREWYKPQGLAHLFYNGNDSTC